MLSFTAMHGVILAFLTHYDVACGVRSLLAAFFLVKLIDTTFGF
jgi:hypothetical protein